MCPNSLGLRDLTKLLPLLAVGNIMPQTVDVLQTSDGAVVLVEVEVDERFAPSSLALEFHLETFGLEKVAYWLLEDGSLLRMVPLGRA